MNTVALTTTPALVSSVSGPLWLQAEYGDCRILFDGTDGSAMTQASGFLLTSGTMIKVEASGAVYAVAYQPAHGVRLHVSTDGPPALLPVTPQVGAVGLITLLEFVSGELRPTSPTTAPPYHGAKSVIIKAPESNAAAIYFSQFPNVIPPTGTFGTMEYFDNPDFASQGDWESPSSEWTFTTGSGALELSGSAGDDYKLFQEINLPPGNYNASLNASSVVGFELFISVGDNLTSVLTAAGAGSVEFSWPGGLVEIGVVPVWDGTTDPSEVILSEFRLESLPPAPSVGTPLNPGESPVILTARDMDLSRGLFIVPTIGETTDKVIVNYQY